MTFAPSPGGFPHGMRLFSHLSAALILIAGVSQASSQATPDHHTTTRQTLDFKTILTLPASKLSQIFMRNNALRPNSRLNQNFMSAPAAPLAFTSPVFNQSVADSA